MRKIKKPKFCLLIFLVLLSFSNSSFAKKTKPNLIVLISIDQFRADTFSRFHKNFLPARQKNGKPGGFKYLLKNGAYFPNAETPHAANLTCPGHATMLTGALPYMHGIIGNYWYSNSKKKLEYCVKDQKSLVVYPSKVENKKSKKSSSPKTLLVTTLGDELKNLYGNQSIVASIAVKDRSAILLGGHRADFVVWFDKKAGTWISSDYYFPKQKLPKWFDKWTSFRYSVKKVPRQWKRLLAKKHYKNSTSIPEHAINDFKQLKRNPEYGLKFPHHLKNDEMRYMYSPWGEYYTMDTAVEMIKALKLGSHAKTDLLTIGLSAHDKIGHTFGQMSEEMQDITLREDRMLANFFAKLQKLVPGGLKKTVIVLTSDHGINSYVPGAGDHLKLPGQSFLVTDFRKKASDYFRKKFKLSQSDEPIPYMGEPALHFDRDVLKKKKISLEKASKVMLTWLREQKPIAAAYTKTALLDGKIPPTNTAKKMARSVHARRSGDIVYSLRPSFSEHTHSRTTGVNHGPAAIQEASVPLIFMGRAFKKGTYQEKVYLNDIAPTLSLLLGVAPPNASEGKPLLQAMQKSALKVQ